MNIKIYWLSDKTNVRRKGLTAEIGSNRSPSETERQKQIITGLICRVCPIETLRKNPLIYTKRERDSMVLGTEQATFCECLVEICGFSSNKAVMVINQVYEMDSMLLRIYKGSLSNLILSNKTLESLKVVWNQIFRDLYK